MADNIRDYATAALKFFHSPHTSQNLLLANDLSGKCIVTKDQVAKLWITLAILTVGFDLNSYLVTQDAHPIFSQKMIVDGREPVALFGIVVGGFLFILQTFVGLQYAQVGGTGWYNRIPVIWIGVLDMTSPLARLYQALVAVVTMLVPVISIFHFLHIVLLSNVYVRQTPEAVSAKICGGRQMISNWDWCGLHTLDDPARLGAEFQGSEYKGGVTFLPGLEPVLLVIVIVLPLISVLCLQQRQLWR